MNEFIWPIRVYHEDSDAAGIVYYANYLKFMERARTEWLRDMGFEQTQLKQQHKLIIVVRKISIEYLKPALFNDLLHIKTRVTQRGKVSMTMAQQVLRDTEILCTAVVKVAALNVNNQRPQQFPPDILKALQKF
ncbi:MAG: tol-pal system-associated acyl-CoA thioesterase [Pseudomonadota bacterium]